MMMMIQQHLFPRPLRRAQTLAWRRDDNSSIKPIPFHLHGSDHRLELSPRRPVVPAPPSSVFAATVARFPSSVSQRSTRDHRSMMLSGHTGGGRRLFTASQWRELEHQALIYKYMATGAPVPHDLVVPLRLATGVDTVPSLAFPPQPQNSLGYWGCYGAAQLGLKAEDPEPGRCRRTDGKKWRCSREAYGDSKYCEKHIHRGKNRSRKPVEVTTATSPAAAYRPSALSISPPTSYHNRPRHGAAFGQAPLQLHLDAGPSYHAAPSPPPSYHRYAPHAQHGAPLFPGGYGPSSSRELQEAETRRQRCLALGADLSLDKPPAAAAVATAATEKPLRRFIDEWTGGVHDATELSISMPTASPSDLAAASLYHDGD